MAQLQRLGEVSAVSVTCQPASANVKSLSDVRFRLQVWACSRFLHPASYQSILESEQSASYMLYLRYKDLAAIHKKLKWLYKSLLLPSFPGKKWLIINAETFLNQRAGMLDQYFADLLKIGEVRRSQVLLEALAPPTTIALKVMGQRGCGKGKFIRHFLKYTPKSATLPARTSLGLPTGNGIGDSDANTPIDVIIDGKTVRIAAVEFVTMQEGQACPWYLSDVKHLELILIAKPFPMSASSSCVFSETRCSRPSDPLQQSEIAFTTVSNLLREYLKRTS